MITNSSPRRAVFRASRAADADRTAQVVGLPLCGMRIVNANQNPGLRRKWDMNASDAHVWSGIASNCSG